MIQSSSEDCYRYNAIRSGGRRSTTVQMRLRSGCCCAFMDVVRSHMKAEKSLSIKLTNYMHIYFANHCRRVSGQHLDATEELDVLLVPLGQAVEMVMDNEICCNSSAHGILRVAKMLGV